MFDVKSIMFLFGMLSAFTGLLFVYYLLANRKYDWHLISFTISKFLQTLAVIGLGLLTIHLNTVLLHISISFLIMGYALETFNLATFDKSFNKYFMWGMFLPPVLIVLLSFSLLHLSYHILAQFTHAVAAYCFGLASINLWTKRKKSKFAVLVSVTYMLFSLTWVYSATLAFLGGEAFKYLSGDTLREILIYTFATLNLIVGSVGYLLMLKDLDELQIKKKNEKIESDNEMLKELNAKKDKFFSIIAHDLKGPIGGLLNLGEILHKKHDELPSDKKEELLRLLVASTKETSNLLENLLQWSRSETKQIEMAPRQLSIDALVNKSLNLLRQHIEEKNIVIRKNIDESIFVWADQNMIDTVLRNLLSNAIKYVNKNGRININCQPDMHNNHVNISVNDNGIGIDQEVLSKLFNIDNNLSTKGTLNEPGTGLGLKICKEFIQANSGTIHVESKINKGSTFTISLPFYNLETRRKEA
ncbi:MAG: HAMP domain-containing sensor histidine kinase [Cyclobacteriaceae bacterium]